MNEPDLPPSAPEPGPASPADATPNAGRGHERIQDDPHFAHFGRVMKRFLWPFLVSFAIAYVGSARGADWLHFVGLGGVGLTMLGLLVWLIS